MFEQLNNNIGCFEIFTPEMEEMLMKQLNNNIGCFEMHKLLKLNTLIRS